jgi:catechol 2,3-dioxygenase-like lactoylglutathione lyase family enzyme
MAYLDLVTLVVRDYDAAIAFFVNVLQFDLVDGGGLFLRVDDFEATYTSMRAAGVVFVSAPRTEAYGQIAVFQDLEGNRWDLLGPLPGT